MCKATITINGNTYSCAMNGKHKGKPHVMQGIPTSRIVIDGFLWDVNDKGNMKLDMNQSVMAHVFGPFDAEFIAYVLTDEHTFQPTCL